MVRSESLCPCRRIKTLCRPSAWLVRLGRHKNATRQHHTFRSSAEQPYVVDSAQRRSSGVRNIRGAELHTSYSNSQRLFARKAVNDLHSNPRGIEYVAAPLHKRANTNSQCNGRGAPVVSLAAIDWQRRQSTDRLLITSYLSRTCTRIRLFRITILIDSPSFSSSTKRQFESLLPGRVTRILLRRIGSFILRGRISNRGGPTSFP